MYSYLNIVQVNWVEVCRVVSEELVAIWLTARIPYDHLTGTGTRHLDSVSPANQWAE